MPVTRFSSRSSARREPPTPEPTKKAKRTWKRHDDAHLQMLFDKFKMGIKEDSILEINQTKISILARKRIPMGKPQKLWSKLLQEG